ncbi:MAG: class I SAM-dependent methyltransferase [Polyangiaceae bacterium]
MTDEDSSWVPKRRIRTAVVVALLLGVTALAGAWFSRLLLLLLLLPSLAAAATALVMLGVRHQLSPRGGGFERRIHALVVDRLALSERDARSVLDVGCGDASLLAALLDRAPTVVATGVDFWGDDWDYAQTACEARLALRGLHATFRRMDAAHLDFAAESFDAVTSVMCFHEVRGPSGAQAPGPLLAVREAHRVLRPGGHFVFVDRFADTTDYGPPAALEAALACTEDVQRVPLVPALRVPWPLNGWRALGPVELICGRKRP